MRCSCHFDIAGIVKIIGLQNWDLKNWNQRGRHTSLDTIFDSSQDRWADSYNSVLTGSIHTENLTVDPVSQSAEFTL